MEALIRRGAICASLLFAVACGGDTAGKDPVDSGNGVTSDAGMDGSMTGDGDAGAEDTGNGGEDGGNDDTGADVGLADMGGTGDDAGSPDMPAPGRCGNGIPEAGEECDDGDDDEDDECSSTCRFTCGDGVVGAHEACDTAIAPGEDGSCPVACDDMDACTTDTLQGSGCEATCVHGAITACTDGDGCCAPGCDATNDDDCAPTCGNGVVEPGETCDGDCPAPSCDDGVACTVDAVVSGSAATCDLVCENTAITACIDDDGCCPAMCDVTNDDDCSPTCGNGTIEGNETCDGDCPTTCDDGDACTNDSLSGSAAQCNAVCVYAPQTACVDGDGCCPIGCTSVTDDDCTAVCGDGTVEQGEQCDDGNTTSGDGCDSMCQVEGIAFRVNDLELKDPHIYADLPILGCRDVTNSVPLNLAPAINDMMSDAIRCDGDCNSTTDDDGVLDLSFVLLFDSLDQAQGGTGDVTVLEAECTAPLSSTMCAPSPGGLSHATTYTTETAADCLDELPNTTRPYTPEVDASVPPCFATDTVTLTLDLSGILIPLTDVQFGASYVANPATSMTNGLLRGFLSEAAADAIIIPESIDFVGGEPLSSFLPGGTDSCANHSDLDVGPDGVTPGWWFYLNFPAERVPYLP